MLNYLSNTPLVIGADNHDPQPGGERECQNVPASDKLKDLEKLREYILEKIAVYCEIPLPDLQIAFVPHKPEVNLLVITIPPTDRLLVLKRDMATKKSSYRRGMVIFRDGQEVRAADPISIDRLRAEFQRLVPPQHNPYFQGRQSETQQSINALTAGQPVVIQGGPGLGKSALARHILHQPEIGPHFPGGLIWIDADNLMIPGLCRAILQKLDPDKLNDDENTYSTIVQRILTERSRILVILDNLSQPDVGQEFAEKIWTHVLISTRQRFIPNNGILIELGVLDALTAHHVFCAYAGRPEENQQTLVQKIVAEVGFHTLAVEIAARRVESEGMPLTDLLQRLKNPQMRLTTLQFLDEMDNPYRNVVKSFFVSWERLSGVTNAQRIFKTIASFSPSGCNVAALAFVTELSLPVCTDVVGVLLRAGLLEKHSDRRLRMHTLLRDFGQAVCSEEELTEFPKRVIDWAIALTVAALDTAIQSDGQIDLQKGLSLSKNLYGLSSSHGLERIHYKYTKETIAALEQELSNLLYAIDLAEKRQQWYEFGLLCGMLNHGSSGILTMRGYWEESRRLVACLISNLT